MENVVNTEQAELWNAERAKHWVDMDDRHERMLRPFTAHLLDAAAIGSGVRVLDVGCGCGHTTRAAAGRAAPAEVLGVDLSGPMLARARQLADDEGLGNARFEQADAQTHRFPAHGFDAAISRFGVMFFVDPVAAFANIRTALATDGRSVFVCWQQLADNPWITVALEAVLQHVEPPDPVDPAAPGPFALADPDRIRSILREAGYVDVSVEPVREVLSMGADPADAMTFLRATSLGRAALDPALPDAAARAVEAAALALEPFATDAGVLLDSAAWLVHARPG